MGSLDEPNRFLVVIATITSLIGLIASYFFVNQLNALQLGKSKAIHLGVNSVVTVRVLFVIASLLTGVSVAVAGVIGFVGLAVPHLIRLLAGNDYRLLLMASFMGGGIFLVVCDMVARTIIAPNELPIGVITGIIGGVVFILALKKSSGKKQVHGN